MGKKRDKTGAAHTRGRPPPLAAAAGHAGVGNVGGLPAPAPPPTRPDVEALVATATAASARLDFPAAVTALTAAVATAPTDAALHEALAVALLEGGENPDAAAASLRRSIELAPDVGGTKYMYLAQLAEADPPEALRLVRSGIRNLRAELGFDPDGGPLGGTGEGGLAGGEQRATGSSAPAAAGAGTTTVSRGLTAPRVADDAPATDDAGRADALRQLCSAYCAAAEVLLALAEAEGEPGGGGAAAAAVHDAAAEAALAEAAALGGSDGGIRVEAGLGLANLRLSQGRRPEAKAEMRSVCRALVAGVAAARAATEAAVTAAGSTHGGAAGAGWEAGVAEVEPPALEVRIAAGKQAVEVGLYRLALAVLGGVVEEEDRNVEVWYLLAWSHARLGEAAAAAAALGRLRQAVAEGDVEGVLEGDLVDRLEASLAKGEKIVGGEASDADSEAEADDEDGGGMDTGSDSGGE